MHGRADSMMAGLVAKLADNVSQGSIKSIDELDESLFDADKKKLLKQLSEKNFLNFERNQLLVLSKHAPGRDLKECLDEILSFLRYEEQLSHLRDERFRGTLSMLLEMGYPDYDLNLSVVAGVLSRLKPTQIIHDNIFMEIVSQITDLAESRKPKASAASPPKKK